jgi:hypothetical protein
MRSGRASRCRWALVAVASVFSLAVSASGAAEAARNAPGMKLKLRTDSQHQALANGAIGVRVRVDGRGRVTLRTTVAGEHRLRFADRKRLKFEGEGGKRV